MTATLAREADCQRTWPSDRPTVTEDTFRQHRCGLRADHPAGACTCRYCGQPRRGPS